MKTVMKWWYRSIFFDLTFYHRRLKYVLFCRKYKKATIIKCLKHIVDPHWQPL